MNHNETKKKIVEKLYCPKCGRIYDKKTAKKYCPACTTVLQTIYFVELV